MGEQRISGVPECGYAVHRRRLVDTFARTAPDLTLVVAPSGYGKTVLAAQFARSHGDHCLWLSMNGCSPSNTDLLSAVATRLRSDTLSTLVVRVQDSINSQSARERLRNVIEGINPVPSLVVLDGIDVLQSTDPLLELLRLLRETGLEGIRIVCTCRAVDSSAQSDSREASCWTVTRRELEFAAEQTTALASHFLQREVDAGEVEALFVTCAGQPALLVLLLRHVMCHGGPIQDALKDAPLDVGDYLRRCFIAPLGEAVLCVLGAAALLGYGSLSDLGRVCEVTPAQALSALRSAPLIRLTTDAVGIRGFEMNCLAAVEYGRALTSIDSGEARRVTDATIRELESRRDFHRLFAVLVQLDKPERLVDTLGRIGNRLIDEDCLDLLDSLLSKIPASVQSGDARLLLLGALLLRCRGDVSKALERVGSARRLAAMQNDLLLERDCLLVEVRLRFDACQFRVLLRALESAHESAGLAGDHDGAALLSAYLAASHAQLGDVVTGRRFVERYQALCKTGGVRAATKTQAVSMILLVLGIICGDISTAVAVLRDARGTPDQPLESKLLCDGNLAALLLEMGRVRDSLAVSHEALENAHSSGFVHLIDSFRGTDAAARAGGGDTADAETLMVQAIESALCPSDESNIAYNRMYRSTVRRSAGMLDEALTDADHALVVFSRETGHLPIMACLARCEVAASMKFPRFGGQFSVRPLGPRLT